MGNVLGAPVLRRGPALLMVLLLVLVMVAVTPAEGRGHQGLCERGTQAEILLPTLSDNPPPISTPDMGGVILWWILPKDMARGETFYLWSQSELSVPGVVLADFNVAFFSSTGHLIQTFSNVGPVTGTVPEAADHGIVWMRTGPESPLNQVGGARFTFASKCSAPPGPF